MEKLFKYQIYKITNNISGKMYVGQHKVRKNEGPRTYMGKGIALIEAYKKYGIKNFQKIIIEEIEDTEKHEYVSEREKYWIKKLNTLAPKGYNISEGGEGGINKEIALKGAITRKLRGYKHSKETKEKISKSNKNKPKSEIHKQHLKENHKTRKLHIISFENKNKSIQTFESVSDIAKRFNIPYKQLTHHSAVGDFCNGIRLDDYIGKKFVDNCLSKVEKEKIINAKYKDPIKNDIVSFYTLRNRKIHNVNNLYTNVIIKDQIIDKF